MRLGGVTDRDGVSQVMEQNTLSYNVTNFNVKSTMANLKVAVPHFHTFCVISFLLFLVSAFHHH